MSMEPNLSIGSSMSPDMAALKAKLKGIWESGDYSIFAQYLEKGALEFFDRLQIAPGTKLLDIACGAGQLIIPAARRGIEATGVDIAENLVNAAIERGVVEDLDVLVEQGDAEALPYQDESFDVVMSLIGNMFAPRPELVASEMIRVARRGGRIIMGNWTPEGHVGEMFKIIGKYAKPSPLMPSPVLWGDEKICRERLSWGVRDLKMTKRLYPMDYPFGPAMVVDFFIKYYGPTNRAYASLDEGGKKDFHEELTALWTRNNSEKNGGTKVRAEYLEVQGIRA